MITVPVAIIGSGPVGLAASLALSRFGIRSVVLERRGTLDDHPRAHVVNARSMEILSVWGLSEPISEQALAETRMGNFLWMSSLAGDQLGKIGYGDIPADRNAIRQTAAAVHEVSCAQDVVERIMLDTVMDRNIADVRFNSEVTGIEQADNCVRLAVNGVQGAVEAQYVIAADGASSPARRHLGIEMNGPRELARFVAMYFHADLSEWTEDLPAVLYWIVNPEAQGVFIALDGHGRWTFHLRIDPEKEAFEDFTPERCLEVLADAIGGPLPPIDLRRIGEWVMSGQIAQHYRAGRVLLAGDAAHRFPPTGGFGMNTGIQDVHNLAWKLAGVLGGWASESLLDTYESERLPVGDLNCRQSVVNFERLEHVGCWSLDSATVAEGLDDPGEHGDLARARFREALEEQRDHFDKLNQELGFSYESDAVVPDGSVAPSVRDRIKDYVPGARPGSRAAHYALETPDGEKLSTIDLFDDAFVLLVNNDDAWDDAIGAAPADVPLRKYVIGRDLIDPVGAWASIYGLDEGGAVLVRPDGHVAFRSQSAPGNPADELDKALRHVVARGEAREPV